MLQRRMRGLVEMSVSRQQRGKGETLSRSQLVRRIGFNVVVTFPVVS